MKIAIDLDGTICTWHPCDYERAELMSDRAARVRQLAKMGHEIWIYTARGSGDPGPEGAEHRWGDVTRDQLSRWDIPYTRLIFGKPTFDLLIDDRAIAFSDDWVEEVGRRDAPSPDARSARQYTAPHPSA